MVAVALVYNTLINLHSTDLTVIVWNYSSGWVKMNKYIPNFIEEDGGGDTFSTKRSFKVFFFTLKF